MIDELLTADQVAALFKVHVTTVYRLATSGRLRAHRIGEGEVSRRGLRIPRSAVNEYLNGTIIESGKAA
ncbi:helix-turn-helix domain-containing protein [[Kitasatospora] papulosa]|uniref:helix-turn-helix domain-containing protein n=1 Tax=[Kitasatospora] papulosa TaxID=1464011 RepID=UPI003867ABD4|nr:helix-turn-helix domain-containing protein [[Kitasatospora] papulosa]